MRAALVLPVLLLAACKPQPPGPAPASLEHAQDPPAARPSSDFGGDIKAVGTEPFWALALTGGTTLTLTRPDAPPLTAKAPGAVIRPGQASWTGKTGDGGELVLSLTVTQCSDGMSDRVYPMAAEVKVGGELLIGCAAKAGALDSQPKP